MLNRIYAPSKREQGFTLLELLIVVIIIGILAAIALPIFLNQQRAVVDAAVKSDVHNTTLQVQQWQVDHKNATAADAAAYIAQSGRVTATTNNGYLGVVVNSDGTYGVCGYNPKGLKLTGPTSAFVFEGATGHFGVGTGCYNGVGLVTGGNTGDGSTGPGNPTTGTIIAVTDENGNPILGTGSGNSGGDTGTPGSGTPGTGTGTGTGTPGSGTPGGVPAGGAFRLDPHPDSHGITDPKITGGASSGGGPNGGSGTTDPGPGGTGPSTPPSTPPYGGDPGGSDGYVNPYPTPTGFLKPSTGGFYSNWYDNHCMNRVADPEHYIDADSTCLRITGAIPFHSSLFGSDYAYLMNGTVSDTLTQTHYGNGEVATSAKHSLHTVYLDPNTGKWDTGASYPIWACSDTPLAGSCDFFVPFNTSRWPYQAAGYCATLEGNHAPYAAVDDKRFKTCANAVGAD